MTFNSFDVSDKSEREKHIHIPSYAAGQNPQKTEVRDVLHFLHFFQKGALTIGEAFLIFTYDPFNQSICPKRLENTKSKQLEHYLLFDTIRNQVFAPSFLISHDAKTLIHEQINEHCKKEIHWVDVPSSEWELLHTTVTDHIDELSHTQKSIKIPSNDLQENSLVNEKIQENEEMAKKEEEKKKKQLEKLQNQLEHMTLAELAKILSKILDRAREIEEEFMQKIEEEKEKRFVEKKEHIEAKELLKEEIKLEVAKMRLVAEAQKKLMS